MTSKTSIKLKYDIFKTLKMIQLTENIKDIDNTLKFLIINYKPEFSDKLKYVKKSDKDSINVKISKETLDALKQLKSETNIQIHSELIKFLIENYYKNKEVRK